MRLPSVKTLRAVFGDDAKQARAILEMTRAELDNLPAGEARNRECWCRPRTYDVRLRCLDALGHTYGLEAFEHRKGHAIDYLNTGEMYAPTLIYDGSYRVVCLGDYIERHGSQA